MSTETKSKGSVGSAIFWMTFLSLILGWLPGFGSLIAGIVGGKKAGGVGKAFAAVILPGVILGIVLAAAAGTIAGIPLIGAVAGAGTVVLSLVGVGPLLLGAVIGGALA